MSDTTTLAVGHKGRVVIPAPVRSRHGWHEGTVLVGFDTGDGFTLMSREAALTMVRAQLDGPSLVDELIAERRAQAATERDAS
ncbi:MAG: AbrB/MazE/SpoVT family DNA-binding domain-containing protein [Bifidobacteriaceae bacterium]|jgi:AbrB family looped-hinge helix DNA binding protein|nr:AbrB/MazE/SpoVT family DNA-binding domain-containing protein [Bifidobacteriaceae bacterium]